MAGKDLESLSEQQLISCDSSSLNYGCDGGIAEFAFMQVQSVGGLVSEEEYPYEELDTLAVSSCDSSLLSPSNFKATVDNWQYVDLGDQDEEFLQLSLIKAGPLALTINASGMEYYDHGVDDYEFCSASDLDHAVLLVGFGTTDEGVDYWTIKNSFGEEYGEGGYYRMVRGKNSCGVTRRVLTAIVNER